MKKYIGFLIIALLIAWLILRPILPTGAWYPMHDRTHPERIALMQSTMLNGQFPPIWADTINGGYGYPLFHFYAPLFHLFTSLIGFNFYLPLPTTALKITLIVATLTGVMGIMLFSRRWGRVAATVSAFAFAMSPFMAIELYVRGAFSEYLSLCLLPWVFLATESLSSRSKIALAGVSIALFVLSHNLIPVLALPMVLIWMLYHNKGQAHRVAWTILLSIGLTTWFTLPLIFERQFVRADKIARNTNYALHFVEPWQLWNSTWGFGGSTLGIEDGMSFKLGKLQIILGITGLLLAFIKKKKSLILIGGFLMFALYLATPYAKVVWDALPTLQLVQFPWRSLGIVVVLLSLLAGFAVSRLPSRPLRVLLAMIVIVTLWKLGGQYFKPQEITTSPMDKVEQFSSDQISDIAPVIPEYMPVWFTGKGGVLPNEAAVDETGDRLLIGQAYYPTWKAYVNGQQVELQPDKNGLVSIDLPIEDHVLELKPSHTNLEYVAYTLTLLSVGYTVGLLKERG